MTPKSARTMWTIWAFSARPFPVRASLACWGAYSLTGTPARAAAASTTPRAWPSTSAERGDTPAKTVSTATASARARENSASSPSRMSASRRGRSWSPGTSTPDSTTRSREPVLATTP